MDPMSSGAALRSYARHGSVSHGRLAPERLAAILRGAAPEGPEVARVRQALLETPATGLAPLAADVGLTAAAVERRLVELFGLDIAALDRMQRGV
ncbi:MAG: hypothetical protein OXN81_16245 [Alphaproteobacteria bacterium]|nr:hypothetical protein [Alphaproteobacteria bacterium]